MITDAQLRLITAAVDGELTPVEAGRLRRLLVASPEARAVYARLKADSDRLRTLPQATPPANLKSRILAAVAAVTPPPNRQPKAEPAAPPATLPFLKRVPRWVPVAVAASLLVAVGAASFWLFTRNGNAAGNMARGPHQPPPATKSGADDPAWAKWLPADSEPRPSIPAPRERPDTGIAVRPAPLPDPERNPVPPVIEPDPIAQAPLPRSLRPDLIGARPLPATRFDLVQVRVPFLKTLADFDRAEVRQDLTAELGRDTPYRIDLFARDTVRGVDAFQAAAKAAGLHVFTDATSHDRLKKKQINAVVIYTESLTADELAELFGKLAAADAKTPSRVFDNLHAVPVIAADVKEITGILGIDPGLFKRPAAGKGEKPEKADPSKPISAGTADHIVKSVTGQGGANGAAKSAVLLTWGPEAGRTPPATSAELKQFRSARGDRKPNVVPAIIVIRQGNG